MIDIYVASPYSDLSRTVRNIRYVRVCEAVAEIMLEHPGQIVFSPIAHYHGIAEFGDLDPLSDIWLKADMEYLRHSKKLVVVKIDGWNKSRGIKREIERAKQLGIPVVYADAQGRMADE